MSIWINEIEVTTNGKYFKYANIAPECYEMINDPKAFINKIIKHEYRADILTFGQILPDIEPKYKYYFEWQEVAALKITTYDNWLNKQIIKENRKNIAKAARLGIQVREVKFDDDLINGIIDIYNESPNRQGKKFWHYNKDFETVKRENQTYLDRSIFIGAYYENNLAGFVKIVLNRECANTQQVISKIKHRDKKPTNALLAKTVEICALRNIQYLQYGLWSIGSLGDFKRYNGFEKIAVPLYYVPLTLKGKVALKVNFHHGIKSYIPKTLIDKVKNIRSSLYPTK